MSDTAVPVDLLERWLDEQPRCDLCRTRSAVCLGYHGGHGSDYVCDVCASHGGTHCDLLALAPLIRATQAALDAIPVVQWSACGGRSRGTCGRWVILVDDLRDSDGYRWGLYVDSSTDGLCWVDASREWSPTLAEAQRAAEAALRSLGVVVREGGQ